MKFTIKKHNKIIQIEIDEEFKYTSEFGNSSIIPFNKDWKTLAIQISGGLDSALLLYLTAKTIKENNYSTKILPLHFHIPTKPPVKALEIINTVEKLLNVNFILPAKEIHIPYELCTPHAIEAGKGKKQFIQKEIGIMEKNNFFDFEFNGNTKNPPSQYRDKFKNDEFREIGRDNPKTIYNGKYTASPHAFIDKSDVVNLYKKFNLLETLAPLTNSCDNFLEIIEKRDYDIPCKNCWWCDERAYGFKMNGILDPLIPNST